MANIQPTVGFGNMTDGDIVEFGLNAGEEYFNARVKQGAASSNSLFIDVGELIKGRYSRMGTLATSPDAQEFAKNVSPDDGKIATVVRFGCDSIVANRFYSIQGIPEGPRRWTGGVLHTARVLIDGKWKERDFVGGASGAQGHLDMAVVYVILLTMGFAWAEREKALAGL